MIGRYPSFNLVQIRSHVVLRPTRAPARAHEFHQPPAIIIVDIHLIGIRQPLCSMQRGRVNGPFSRQRSSNMNMAVQPHLKEAFGSRWRDWLNIVRRVPLTQQRFL